MSSTALYMSDRFPHSRRESFLRRSKRVRLKPGLNLRDRRTGPSLPPKSERNPVSSRISGRLCSSV